MIDTGGIQFTGIPVEHMRKFPAVNIVLLGAVGSRTLGTSSPLSDYDYNGVYVGDVQHLLALDPPQEVIEARPGEVVDYNLYEIGKFLRLVLAGVPEAVELLFLTEYCMVARPGRLLTESRGRFLSTGAVKMAFIDRARGKVTSALSNAERRAKDLFYAFRALDQLAELLGSGHLTYASPSYMQHLNLAGADNGAILDLLEKRIEQINGIQSVLRDMPDRDHANEVLMEARGLSQWI